MKRTIYIGAERETETERQTERQKEERERERERRGRVIEKGTEGVVYVLLVRASVRITYTGQSIHHKIQVFTYK